MSGQFRIKNIDSGLSDSWSYRINDSGLVLGDDVVAEDPNELALAITETQELLLHATVYAPNQLVDLSHGLFERVKTIEDTFGSISLQDAYTQGNFITVEPGRNLILGANAELDLDSSGNLKLNTNTMKILNGSLDMNLSYSGISSSTVDLIVATTSPTKDLTLQGGKLLYLKDGNLTSNIPFSESGVTALATTAQSVVGAINEVSQGFSSANLQQIYDQSSPSEIQTSLVNGAVRITNSTGVPSASALVVNGNEEVQDLFSENIYVGTVVGSPNLSILSSGDMSTIGALTTSSSVQSPKLENLTGELLFEDLRGTLVLSETSDPSLNTVKQSLKGAVNEVLEKTNVNSLTGAAFAVEHNDATGEHGIINTQASAGTNAVSRINVLNDLGTVNFSVDANGEVASQEVSIPGYTLSQELTDNKTHREGDGSDHSAVATHFSASNPHGVVSSVSKQGSPQLIGDIEFLEGAGVSISQAGNQIEISTPATSTLQGVYDGQISGNWVLDTTAGKNLNIQDSSSADILSLKSSEIRLFKNTIFEGNGSLSADTGDMTLDAPTASKKVIIEGVDFSDGSSMAIDTSISSNMVGATNDLAQQQYMTATNGSGYPLQAGTPVCVKSDGELSIPYSDIDEANAIGDDAGESSFFWHVLGIVDEPILPSGSGRVKTMGQIKIPLNGPHAFKLGDQVCVSNVGRSRVKIESNSLIVDSDELTLDTLGASKVFTAITGGGADANVGEYDVSSNANLNLATDETRDNLFDTLDNQNWMASGSPFYIAPFIAGEKAEGRIELIAAGSAGNTVTLTPNTLRPSNVVTLTAVSLATSPSHLEYKVGSTAEETSVYLAEAINRTSRDNGLAQPGHLHTAEAYGSAVLVRYFLPGMEGNNTLISHSGGAASIVQPTGGTAEIDVYMTRRVSTGTSHLCSSANPSGVSISDFSSDESGFPYISRRESVYYGRPKSKHDRLLKIGKIVELFPTEATLQIGISEPEYSPGIYRGALNDFRY